MPQREFWTEAHPTEVHFKLSLPHIQPTDDPTVSFNVLDQSGKSMAWAGGFVPAGFACWAASDAVRAGLEGFECGTPQQAVDAFTRARTEWLQGARAMAKFDQRS